MPEPKLGSIPRDWATPAVTPVNRAWFTSGTLAVQRCARCAAVQHPPEEVCHRCGATEFDYRAVAPRGTVHSFTIAHSFGYLFGQPNLCVVFATDHPCHTGRSPPRTATSGSRQRPGVRDS